MSNGTMQLQIQENGSARICLPSHHLNIKEAKEIHERLGLLIKHAEEAERKFFQKE